MNWKQLMCSERPRSTVHPVKGGDLRTEFEKDYHRIISSASFRRLQDKTQVFPLEQNDFIRTRLTHSLEVSSFAKSLGQSVGSRIITEGKDPDFTVQTQMDIAEVLQCAGLLHDIGNPPFGHFGEDAIRDWFSDNLYAMDYENGKLADALTDQQIADFTHFEGNTQALRVVTKLHFMVDEHGMNLTKALLATIMKYPGSSLEIKYDKKDPDRDIARKKMGYFHADREVFDDVVKSCGTNGRRHPLAFALEAADDIAYRTADIEDAVKKGLVSVELLKSELTKAMKHGDCHRVSFSPDAVQTANKLLTSLDYYYNKAIEQQYEDPQVYAVQNWVVRIQGMLLTAAVDSFIKHYSEIMAGEYKKELLAGTAADIIMDILGNVAYEHAFLSEPILKLEVAADAIFDFLLESFVGALRYYDTPVWKEKATAVDTKLVGLISSSYKQIYRIYSQDADDNEKLYLRLLLATDYVSGMTDSYARRLYRELRGIEL